MLPSLLKTGVCWVLPVLIALSLYATHITSDLYGDEGSTLGVVSEGSLTDHLTSADLCHPPLYFIAAKAFYASTGCAWSIRIPSLLAALGTIIVTAKLADKVLGREGALWAVWLVSCSPILVEFGAEGRPYAMLAFFSVMTGYQLLCFMEHENWKSALFVAGAAIGGLLTHYIFCCHLVFIAGYYFFKQRRLTRHALLAIAVTAPIIGLIGIGVLRNITHSSDVVENWRIDWHSMVNFVARLPVALSFGFSTFKLPSMDLTRSVTIEMVRQNVILLAIMTLAFAVLGWRIVCLLLRRQHHVGFLFCGVVVPIVLALLGILAGLFVTKEKYLIGTIGYYAVLVAAVFTADRRSWVGRGTAIAYLFLVVVSLVHYTAYPNVYSRRMDWTGVRALLRAEMAKGDVLILYRAEHDATRQVSPETEGIRIVDIQAKAQEGYDARDFIRDLAGGCQGRIFLVNNEINRVYMDPQQRVIHSLNEERSFEKHDFGRNLSVYIFFPQREPVSGDGKG